MKQVVQNFRSGDLRIVDLPRPACRPGGVLVANRVSLISVGTERTMVNLASASLVGKARQRPDLVKQVMTKVKQEGLVTTAQKVLSRLDELSPLGYSCAGEVVEVGASASGFRQGDRVAVAGAGYANHAEFVYAPKNLVTAIDGPSDGSPLTFETAAFTTVGAIALHGARQAEPTLGETFVVIGLGLVGQLLCQLLKANGVHVIGSDLQADRVQLARKLGCPAAYSSGDELDAAVLETTNGRGADAAIITAASESSGPVTVAADVCRDRGRVVAVGLTGLNIPRKPFYDKEIDLRMSRSYGPGRYDPHYEEQGHDYPIGYVRWTEQRNMAAFLDLARQEKVRIDELVTHRFPIEDAVQAYGLITGEQAAQAMGVLLTYPSEPGDVLPAETIRVASRSTSPRKKPPTNQVRLGIVGCGNFARSVLLPALQRIPKARLTIACSASGLSARHVAEKFHVEHCTSSYESVIQRDDIDAVVIATTHGTHARILQHVIESGKAAFVEKPLAVNESQLRALDDVVRQVKVAPIAMVGFNRRFAPMAEELRNSLPTSPPKVINYTVNAGEIPAEHWIQQPQDGGGRIIGEACHFIDLLQYLTGSSIQSVYATAVHTEGLPTPDVVQMQLTFDDGSLGVISYLANGDKGYPKERLEVFCSGKIAVLDDFRSLTLVQQGSSKTRKNRLGQDKGHLHELQRFVEAVATGSGSPISWDSQVQTTLATFRALQSISERRPLGAHWSSTD